MHHFDRSEHTAVALKLAQLQNAQDHAASHDRGGNDLRNLDERGKIHAHFLPARNTPAITVPAPARTRGVIFSPSRRSPKITATTGVP